MKGVVSVSRNTRIYARCLECGRSWTKPNALAVGARHTAAFGHVVIASTSASHTYMPDAPFHADKATP